MGRIMRQGITLSSLYRLCVFYGRDFKLLLRGFRDPALTMELGRHRAFDGTVRQYFFVGEVPIEFLEVNGEHLTKSLAFERTLNFVASYPHFPASIDLRGRKPERIWEVVDARMRKIDDFKILVAQSGTRRYRVVDGTTRLSALAATGAKHASILVTLR